MTQSLVIFNAICVLTVLAQAYNYFLLGRKEKVNRYLNLFVLSGFLITETVVAVSLGLWGYWGYVLLSMWGLYNFLGKKDSE